MEETLPNFTTPAAASDPDPAYTTPKPIRGQSRLEDDEQGDDEQEDDIEYNSSSDEENDNDDNEDGNKEVRV